MYNAGSGQTEYSMVIVNESSFTKKKKNQLVLQSITTLKPLLGATDNTEERHAERFTIEGKKGCQ